ncbi:hypothetical protein AB0M43_36235 [Longispora sp. NPDC051575]|uniref:hypothetical protein n=1 Tax=Longispora sp. NPDC051575 TaxID=3154943 RepID=UPI00343D6BA5
MLVRWLLEPDSRDFPLSALRVCTALTGSEYRSTHAAVRRFAAPLLARHGVRWTQVARASQAGGHVVMADSRRPTELVRRGPWALIDELSASGTVPSVVGARLCSLHAKAEALQPYIDGFTAGAPYEHAMGYAIGEERRSDRDRGLGGPLRTGLYPLQVWNWRRSDALTYLRDTFDIDWPRSCCTFCPYQLGSRAGRADLVDRWSAEPTAGAEAVLVEYAALALNPRALLGKTVGAAQLAREHDLEHVLAMAGEVVAHTEHVLVDVRRIFPARHVKELGRADPARKGPPRRSVRRLRTGGRTELEALLRRSCRRHNLDVGVDEHGITRAWVRRHEAPYPSVERFLVVAPATVNTKVPAGFEEAWQRHHAR